MFIYIICLIISFIHAMALRPVQLSNNILQHLPPEVFVRMLEHKYEVGDWSHILKYVSNFNPPLPMSYVTQYNMDIYMANTIMNNPFGFVYRNASVYGGYVFDACTKQYWKAKKRACPPDYSVSQFVNDNLNAIVSKCNQLKQCVDALGEGKGRSNCFLPSLSDVLERFKAFKQAFDKNGTDCCFNWVKKNHPDKNKNSDYCRRERHNQMQATWRVEDCIGVVITSPLQISIAKQILKKIGRPNLSIFTHYNQRH